MSADPKPVTDACLWANVLLLHLWGAVGYLKPGLLPTVAGFAQLVMLCALYHHRKLHERLTTTPHAD
jgi:hypothetical protein